MGQQLAFYLMSDSKRQVAVSYNLVQKESKKASADKRSGRPRRRGDGAAPAGWRGKIMGNDENLPTAGDGAALPT